MTTTVIRNADWVVAWNESAGLHVYRRGVDIAFADDTIAYVGRNYPGAADRVIDGKDRLVLPRLIDIHCCRMRQLRWGRKRSGRRLPISQGI